MEGKNHILDQIVELNDNQPTIGQKRAANVLTYLNAFDSANKEAKKQVKAEDVLERQAKQTRTIELRQSLTTAHLLSSTREKPVEPMGIVDRFRLMGRAGRRLGSMSPSEKSQLFTLAGYGKEEVREAVIRTSTSGALNVATFFMEEFLPDAAGILIGVQGLLDTPFLNPDLTDPRTFMWVMGSNALFYATTWMRAKQTDNFLQNGDLYVTSGSATAAHYLTDKFFEGEERTKRWSRVLGYYANPLELFKESTAYIALFLPVIGPSTFTAFSIMGTTMNLGLIGSLSLANWDARKNQKLKNGSSKN